MSSLRMRFMLKKTKKAPKMSSIRICELTFFTLKFNHVDIFINCHPPASVDKFHWIDSKDCCLEIIRIVSSSTDFNQTISCSTHKY